MKILSAQASQDIAVIVLAALVAAVAVVIVGLIISLLVTRKRLENREEGAQSPPAEQSVQDTPAVQTDEAVAEEQPPAVAEENIAATQKTDNSADIHILPVIVAGGNTRFNIRYNKSFTAKLIQSSDEVKGWYATLKNALLSYKKTKSRISWHTDSINCGRIKLAKFAIRGKTLRLYLALNPEDYAETKYKVEYGEGKRYEAVPCMYRIKNSRRVKYALELIAALAEKYGLILTEREDEDYYLPYEETAPLLARGLIKQINGAPSAEDAEEIEEVEETQPVPVVVAGGNTRFNIRYNKSFTAKLIQSSDEVKGWYATLKNALLSYKKTKSRISWHTDSINCGRIKLAKFAIRGKTLRLYLALNPEDYAETKYKVEYGEGKRYEAVPCMYRIKNSRRVKYALELIAALAEKYGLILTEREDEDYYLPYEETAPLLARGLIKEINGAPSAEDAEEIEEVAEEAEEEIPEEVEQAEEVAATQPPESDGEAAEEESEEEPEEEPEELSESEKEDVEEYDGHSDDEDGIPVIGVMFRRRGKKVYWFDPDGKQWQKGEIAHYVAPDGLRHEVIVVDMAKRSPDKLHLPLKPLHKLRQSNK